MRSQSRPTTRLTALLSATVLAGSGVAVVGAATAPASALLPLFPVYCDGGGRAVLDLDRDGRTYEIRGTCGHIRVSADNATVVIPTATRLEVTGSDNVIDSKSLLDLEVHGARNTITPTSVKRLRATGSGSTIHVRGLLERARIVGSTNTITAPTLHRLVVRGAGNRVSVSEGLRSRVPGRRNVLSFDLLERVVLPGRANRVEVRQGRTIVRGKLKRNQLDLTRAR